MAQTPQQEAQERIAESVPVYMLPRVIAAEDYRLSQAAYRDRVDAADAAGWAALGMGGGTLSAGKVSKELGGITIQGDTYQYYGDASTKQLPAQQAPAPPVSGPLAKLAGPALLGAALLGSGAGGVALYNYLSAEPTAVEQPVTEGVPPPDFKLGVDVKDRQ